MKLIVIGRDPHQAEIVIPNEYVSNYHAEIIQLDNGDTLIIDKSTNGTFVNGEKLVPGKETPVRRGDKITFAGLDLALDWSMIPPVKTPEGVRQVKSIGSHYMNTVIINGPGVSRFHATIREMSDGKWYICDHSKNGTSVNGKSLPKNKYVRIKHGDEISCGGIPVENPVKGGNKMWMYIGIAAAAICAVVLVFFGLKQAKRPLSDQQIIAMYDNSVALMIFSYHFEVTCGTLPINGLPNPFSKNSSTGEYMEPLFDEFVVEDNKIIEYDGNNPSIGTGTGFFVGEKNMIVTNRHVAKPWEKGEVNYGATSVSINKAAEDLFRNLLTELYEDGFTEALPYISQVEVHGVLDKMAIVPNGKYLIDQSIYSCAEVACSSKEEDLAIFKLLSDHMPLGVKPIPIDKISKEDPQKGEHILTIGFPMGINLFDNPEDTEIQAHATAGAITRNDGRYAFGFDAATSPGASGSPIFDVYGNLVGILHAGHIHTQGFNYGIRSVYLSSLLEQAGITK